MKFDKLTNDNFLIYATKNYEVPNFGGVEELNEDLKILTYVKRNLRKYLKHKVLKERLILNQIITLSNVFGNMPTSRMLFFYCDKRTHPQLKAFLEFLNILPLAIPEVELQEIESDKSVLDALGRI